MVSSVRSSGRTFRALKASKSLYRRITTMATPQKIQIVPQDTGLWRLKQTDEAAKKASELLQQDLEVTRPTKFIRTKRKTDIGSRSITSSSMTAASIIT